MSSGELNENRNLIWTKRGKARLILIFSTNANCENMAYRSFRSEKCSARDVRKVTTGITGKTWPIDPLGLRNVQLEMSEKLPQG